MKIRQQTGLRFHVKKYIFFYFVIKYHLIIIVLYLINYILLFTYLLPLLKLSRMLAYIFTHWYILATYLPTLITVKPFNRIIFDLLSTYLFIFAYCHVHACILLLTDEPTATWIRCIFIFTSNCIHTYSHSCTSISTFNYLRFYLVPWLKVNNQDDHAAVHYGLDSLKVFIFMAIFR